MRHKSLYPIFSAMTILAFVSLACQTLAPTPTATITPIPATDTATPSPTNTRRPSSTPKPTKTPDIAATRHREDMNEEVQTYFDKGYLTTTKGNFDEFDDFEEEWDITEGYGLWSIGEWAEDFFMSAHFSWSTDGPAKDISGCGFAFAIRDNQDHFAVFLDKSGILFLEAVQSLGKSYEVERVSGTGEVELDDPLEADFTLIVRKKSAIVLVDGRKVGVYELPMIKLIEGDLAVSIISGTDKGYGTRCEISNFHLWRPK